MVVAMVGFVALMCIVADVRSMGVAIDSQSRSSNECSDVCYRQAGHFSQNQLYRVTGFVVSAARASFFCNAAASRRRGYNAGASLVLQAAIFSFSSCSRLPAYAIVMVGNILQNGLNAIPTSGTSSMVVRGKSKRPMVGSELLLVPSTCFARSGRLLHVCAPCKQLRTS